MANRSAWTPGNLNSGNFTNALNSADMASMTAGYTVLSSIADIPNTTNCDQFGLISFKLVIASSTIIQGANFAFFLYGLNQDLAHYGDGQLATPGTPANITPTFGPCFYFDCPIGTQTTFYGDSANWGPIVLPMVPFRIAMQNNCGFNLSAGTQVVQVKAFNQNLNA